MTRKYDAIEDDSLRKFNDHDCDIPFRFELSIGNANQSNFVSRVKNLQLTIEFF